MTSPSNLYAEKIFAEHPLALWALDDKIDFVSLLDNNEKAMSGWTITNGTLLTNPAITPQVSDSPLVGISVPNSNIATVVSPAILNITDLDQNKNTFTISTHFRSPAEATIKLGYKLSGQAPVTETFNYIPGDQDEWAFLSKTFDIPQSTSVLSVYVSIKQTINISNDFYFNNMSFGQWSESYATVSSGVVPQLLSDYESVNLPGTPMAVSAKSYGLTDSDGYYLSKSNKLYATNEGFPIVYGASNLTKLVPSDNGNPSLIIPGFGFLNDAGKYIDMTAEMWLRISPRTVEYRRIFGPINSDDGIYVQGEFLVIKIGKSVGAYFVGEWGRPMLLDFRVSVNTASLLVDGEQVISITTDTESLTLPKPFIKIGDVEKSQDWLGFYTYSDIKSFELDCVAIYSYQIPELVAKRRFVYGQGVEFPELSSSSLIGASSFIDYSVANYANNYIYPDMGRWNQGILDNAVIKNNNLVSPEYELPSVVFNNKSITTDEWLAKCSLENLSEQTSYIDLTLADSASKTGGYIFFKKLNMLSGDVKGFYGVFETRSTAEQMLFRIENNKDGSYFTISTQTDKIKYELKYPNEEAITVYSEPFLTVGDAFAAGLDISAFASVYGGAVSKFFGASSSLSVYVGGQSDFTKTLNGKIYKVGFSTGRNLAKISGSFSNNGILGQFGASNMISGGLVTDNANFFLSGGFPQDTFFENTVDAGGPAGSGVLGLTNHIASYTLNPRLYIGSFVLDISADSYWQDYVPLTYLSKALENADGDQVQTIDFVQFNITNPAIPVFTANNEYNTSNSQVKTYITFQYMSTGPNTDYSKFIYTKPLSSSGIIEPVDNWMLTKYEIVDNSIIYLPKDANFNKLAIVIHVEIEAKSIISNPIKIKSIQLASQALSSIKPTEISTRFGETLSAYTMRGIYPDYKAKNPVSIYKSSTPYLYLTNNSGIEMRGILESTKRRGIRSKINSQRSGLYRVGAIQILAKYSEQLFPLQQKKLITVSAKNKTISLYVQASNSSRTRGRVFAINDKTNLEDQSVVFYLNGIIVKELYLNPNDWNMLGVQFQEALDFNSIMGYLDISGPLLVHGMSNYRLTSSQDSITSILRTWSQVRTMIDKTGNEVTNWEDFLDTSAYGVRTWENILYIPTLKTYLVDPRTVYRLYTGTNKVIVGDTNKLKFTNYSYKVYNDIRWQANIYTAV